MEERNAGAGENTRTVKTVHYTPGLGTAKCWNHFHLRKACLEVKTPQRHTEWQPARARGISE